MKTIFTAVIASVLLASPAPADMSQGDGARSPMADGSGHSTFSRSYVPVPVKATKAPTVNPWSHDYAPYGVSGALPTGAAGVYPVPGATTAKELDAQRRAYEAGVDPYACYADIRPISCVWGTSHNGGSTGGSD